MNESTNWSRYVTENLFKAMYLDGASMVIGESVARQLVDELARMHALGVQLTAEREAMRAALETVRAWVNAAHLPGCGVEQYRRCDCGAVKMRKLIGVAIFPADPDAPGDDTVAPGYVCDACEADAGVSE